MRSTKRRRRTAPPPTLSDDMWAKVCLHFFKAPELVFRIMMALRSVWRALRHNRVFWEMLYRQTYTYHTELIKFGTSTAQLAAFKDCRDKHRMLQLIFGRRCEACAARYGHSLFQPLMERLCQWCLQERLVSNRELLARYGLHFSDLLLEYYRKGGRLVVHKQHMTRKVPVSSSLFRLTCSPLDFEYRKHELSLLGLQQVCLCHLDMI